ncbi:cobalamin biosynthesis protein CobD [Arsenicitalea aurantiaca]|uniref:Cobalamin biosynthesis protein CobD n=1 Tax=Arsenicitalea aurantiaca TaxID=1783274 RepID=A0A433X3Y4_9HYPH|nr:adenosylcobinamide-phosphate synthase CbiB [Arsenicitalea aurantiaca]RUT28775.1 cobalamin biosynthesis protein CobD [Arsenicitalea aurantiaca]
MEALLAPLALVLERLLGYPQRLVSAIGHPVIWMGRFLSSLELRLNAADATPARRRRAGLLALVLLLGATLVVTLLVSDLCRRLPGGWILEAIIATSILAQKELGRAVAAVATGLRRSLAEGREAVSHIVGRDPEPLDEAGVSRAAIESLAESASDGVVAPLFWLVLLGLPGIALYKAINTADSMIGHRNERYIDFGRAAARLDDLVNLVPARLTAIAIAAAAMLVSGADPEAAWKTALRDARRHASPNAGWPEAAMAGALGFALGGPRAYAGEIIDLPRFGDGRDALGPDDIERALTLYKMLLNVILAATVLLALIRL